MYRGQPIPDGSIGFYPCEATEGAPVIVPIANGKYTAESQGGVPVGSYQVVILGVRKVARRSEPSTADDDLPPLDPIEQYLPAKYNGKTELRLAIEPTPLPLTQDYTLTD